LSNGSVDGFIIAVARESQVKKQTQHIQTILDSDIPVLMFDRVVSDIECDKVIVDDFKSVYEATEYLIEKEQRKNILLVSNIEELTIENVIKPPPMGDTLYMAVYPNPSNGNFILHIEGGDLDANQTYLRIMLCHDKWNTEQK
jgi:hypothetical protein